LSARSAAHLHNRRRSRLGDLVISQPWSRAAPRGAETASSYSDDRKQGRRRRPPGRRIDRCREKIQIEQISMTGGGTQVKSELTAD